jgi:hypothetical protein
MSDFDTLACAPERSSSVTELARLSTKTAFEIASCYRPFLPHLVQMIWTLSVLPELARGKPPGGNSEGDGPEGVRDRPCAILPIDSSYGRNLPLHA